MNDNDTRSIFQDNPQAVQNLMVYGSILMTNLLYVLIVWILIYFTDGNFAFTGFYVFLILNGLSFAVMLFITRNALINDGDRSKTITQLAVAHVPCLLGLTYVMFEYFILL